MKGADRGYLYRGDAAAHKVTMLRRGKVASLVKVEESDTLPAGTEITVPTRRLEVR